VRDGARRVGAGSAAAAITIERSTNAGARCRRRRARRAGLGRRTARDRPRQPGTHVASARAGRAAGPDRGVEGAAQREDRPRPRPRLCRVVPGEHRHRLGQDIAPAALGGEIGYLGLTGATFGDTDNSLTALYWDQSLAERRAGYVAGRIAPDDFTDVLGYANPRTTFQNFAILLNPVIPFPDPGFGGGGGGFITDRVYALGIVSDANGSLTDVEFFPDGAEFFSYGELGWTPSREQRYTTNLHLGAFHVDSRETAGAPESYGLVGSANVLVGEVWMPFGRLGFSDGDAPLANASVTAGVLRYFPRYGDLAGLAFNWADPSDNALDSQFTGELFYRFEVADNIALTADAQLLVNPALNPTEDTIGVFGLRLRFDL
jgi:porin